MGEPELDIANRPVADFNARSDALVSARQHRAMRPRHDLADAWPSIRPLRADRGQMTREGVCRAARIQAPNYGDIYVGQHKAWVRRSDPRIVPVSNAPHEDVDVNVLRQLQLALEAGKIIGQHDHAGGAWRLDGAALDGRCVGGGQRYVARAK